MRGLSQEGADTFRWSATCLCNSSHVGGEEYQRVLGTILASQAHCTSWYSKKETRTLAEKSLSILCKLPISRARIHALRILGSVSHTQAEKEEIMEECLRIARMVRSGCQLAFVLLMWAR